MVEPKIISLPEELLKNPYKYICNHYESKYAFIGRRVFSVVALIPPSLIMPRIPNGAKGIKQKINLLLIANPGSAKTSMAEEFEKIAYNPIFSERMTAAFMAWELKDHEFVTLITSDVAQSLNDEEFIKTLEQILGDEGSLSRNNMHNKEKRKKIEVAAYLSGTPEIIANDKIKDGLLFRCCPIVITHSIEEHEEILKRVNSSVGEKDRGSNNQEIIDFYNSLRTIQEGQNPNIKPITGYIISEEIKAKVAKSVIPLTEPSFEEYGVNAVRQIQETYRFMCSHAFLNIFNREIREDKLIITEKDFLVAEYLIQEEIKTIFQILSALKTLKANGLKTYQQLKKWQDDEKNKEKRMGRTKLFLMEGAVKKT